MSRTETPGSSSDAPKQTGKALLSDPKKEKDFLEWEKSKYASREIFENPQYYDVQHKSRNGDNRKGCANVLAYQAELIEENGELKLDELTREITENPDRIFNIVERLDDNQVNGQERIENAITEAEYVQLALMAGEDPMPPRDKEFFYDEKDTIQEDDMYQNPSNRPAQTNGGENMSESEDKEEGLVPVSPGNPDNPDPEDLEEQYERVDSIVGTLNQDLEDMTPEEAMAYAADAAREVERLYGSLVESEENYHALTEATSGMLYTLESSLEDVEELMGERTEQYNELESYLEDLSEEFGNLEPSEEYQEQVQRNQGFVDRFTNE